MEGAKCDLLFTNAHVLTMDEMGTQHRPGYVAVEGNTIMSLGPMSECPPSGQAGEVIDCAGCYVLPGLINCHTHLPMVYFRGMADDIALEPWLKEHIWPAERQFLNPEFVYEATLLAAAESLKCGVTCVNDMYIFADSVAQACRDAGLRAFVGEGVIQYPTSSAPTWEDGRRLTEELIAKFDDDPLITPTVCAHAPYSCTPEILRAMHAVAQEHQLLYHIHLHESELEPDSIEWGKDDESPTHSLMRIGVLGPRMVAAHCVWISDHDIGHMYEHDCGVAHCPTSNMKLGNGIAPVHSMIEGDLAVGLGTDGAASNNNLNLWEEIHLAALAAKAAYKNPEVVPAYQALSFATSRAAQLLHADHIGQLTAGRRADIVVVETDRLHSVPRYHHAKAPYASLVYAHQAAEVRDTVVDGQLLVRRGKLTRMDEERLISKAQRYVDETGN
jgi:5-methylthioadenosine/S-adenosylhomocysteine deaminase